MTSLRRRALAFAGRRRRNDPEMLRVVAVAAAVQRWRRRLLVGHVTRVGLSKGARRRRQHARLIVRAAGDVMIRRGFPGRELRRFGVVELGQLLAGRHDVGDGERVREVDGAFARRRFAVPQSVDVVMAAAAAAAAILVRHHHHHLLAHQLVVGDVTARR